MSTILVSATPLAGHGNPMIRVAESLDKQGHDILFNTAVNFRERAEASGLCFLPLLGKAT